MKWESELSDARGVLREVRELDLTDGNKRLDILFDGDRRKLVFWLEGCGKSKRKQMHLCRGP